MNVEAISIRIASSYDFRTKALINALVLDEISRLSGADIDTAASSLLDDSDGEKPIHNAIQSLADAIHDHATLIRSKSHAASSPLTDRPDYGTGDASVPRGEKTSVLRQKHNQKTDQTEWALMDSSGKRVLEWFGKQKPSAERVQKSERRVNWFSKGPGKKG